MHLPAGACTCVKKSARSGGNVLRSSASSDSGLIPPLHAVRYVSESVCNIGTLPFSFDLSDSTFSDLESTSADFGLMSARCTISIQLRIALGAPFPAFRSYQTLVLATPRPPASVLPVDWLPSRCCRRSTTAHTTARHSLYVAVSCFHTIAGSFRTITNLFVGSIGLLPQ